MEQWERNPDIRLEKIRERELQMTLLDIFQLASDHSSITLILTLIAMCLIEVSKVKINPISWLCNLLFKKIIEEIKETRKETKSLREEFESFKKEQAFNEATASRRRILRFNDEAVFGLKHTREHFDEIIADIDNYESFCKENPDYQNNKGKMAMSNIKSIYQKCINDNTFV